MPKVKLSVDLPSSEELLAGLDLHELHRPLARAERDLAEAERKLEAGRQRLAELEREVVALPGRIAAGQAPASALRNALVERDGQALQVRPLEEAVIEARGRVEFEQRHARRALEREVERRAKSLARAAAELTPILDALRELDFALGQIIDRRNVGVGGLSWPRCLPDETERENAMTGAVMASRLSGRP